MPAVSVVIPVLDDLERLRACVERLRAQDLADPFEVLIVDNGSRPDQDPAPLAGGAVRVLREPSPGSYAARNRALREASGAAVAFTDSDCRPEQSWLRLGLAALERTGADAVAGAIHLFVRDEAHRTPTEAYETIYAFPQETYVRERRFGATANLFVRRAALARTGPFSTDSMSGGDWEFGQRLHGLGLRMEYAPDAVVHHPARVSWPDLRKKVRRVEGGHAIHRGAARRRFLRSLVPPMRQVGRVLRARLPLKDRVKALGILALVSVTTTGIRFRLLRSTTRP